MVTRDEVNAAFCDFTVAADSRCSDIIGYAHSLFYYNRGMSDWQIRDALGRCHVAVVEIKDLLEKAAKLYQEEQEEKAQLLLNYNKSLQDELVPGKVQTNTLHSVGFAALKQPTIEGVVIYDAEAPIQWCERCDEEQGVCECDEPIFVSSRTK